MDIRLYLLALGAFAIGAESFVVSSLLPPIAGDMGVSITQAGYLVLLYALGFILFATGQFQAPSSVSGRTYLFLLLSGLATGGSWICYFRALKIGQAAQVAPIDKLSVVLVAVFGVMFLGERLTMPNWIGVALIATGAILVAYR